MFTHERALVLSERKMEKQDENARRASCAAVGEKAIMS